MSADTPFVRVRYLLRARAPIALHPWQNAVLYALLADAARGARADGSTQVPDTLMLDAPEVARDRVAEGGTFAFGATIVEPDAGRASKLVHTLADGLARVGRTAPKKPVALGGNFDVIEVRDLVTGAALAPGAPLRPLSFASVVAEYERLLPKLGAPITLRFLSPLRLELPAADADEGHRYADGSRLIAGQLLRAVRKRLAAVGMRRDSAEPDAPFADSAVALAENRLVWLDLGYGPQDRRKSLGGALGRVRLTVTDAAALAALVWGQYARVGRNLHFGFGRYRIEELGDDPTACPRAASPLDLAFTPDALAHSASEHDLDAAELRRAADAVRAGTYTPAPPHRVVLREADGGTRELHVPARGDRALQRLMLARLTPAFDKLFETSSFAWRKGLSRESAARRIERLVADGWAFAVRADFDRFFDNVPQDLLRDRLEAWLGDDATANAVLAFVRSGCPNGVGVPTGAPLSPLLGNMLLDRFDEDVERAGGRLVRYADDFLVLTRTRETADALHARCRALASDLLLQLNDGAAVLDLREPFEFLGFVFRHETNWRYDGPTGPRRVQDLRRGGR